MNYGLHKICPKLTPKNALLAMPASAPSGEPSTLSGAASCRRMQQPEYLPREGDRRAQRPSAASQNARQARRRRRGDCGAHRPPRTQHLRPVRIVKRIVDTKAQFRSLAEPWADTGTSTGRLMLAVLGGLADVERDLIRTRTAEGRERAIKRGQHMGRPPLLTDTQKAEARQRCGQGATLSELARSYNVSESTISRLCP
jgi:Resolvase, N terminal domain